MELSPELRLQWESLSKIERAYVLSCLEEISNSGSSSILQAITAEDYDWDPPSIQQFLEDPFYAGTRTAEMYPLLKRELINIFEKDYEEVILTGAIGFGKSWIASFGLTYDLVRILCLRDPQRYFGLAKGTMIVMMNLSVSGQQAHDVLYSYVLNLFRNLPWAQYRFPNHDYKKQGLYFHEKLVHFKCGSSSEFSAIGANVIGGAMDEANFMIGVRRSRRAVKAGELDQAKVLYDQISRRRKSRFLQKSGKVPGKFWLISSKQFPGDFLERKIEASKDDPNVKVIDYPQWVPKQSVPGGGPYSGKNFYLFIGTGEHRSRILSESTEAYDISKVNLPPGCKILEVPVEYLQEFKEDLYGSIRDIAGHSIQAVNPYFENPDDLDKCICLEEFGDIPRIHPYATEESDIIHPDLIKWDWIPRSSKSIGNLIKIVSKINPGRPRFAHVDLSQTGDATGVCVGHYGGHKTITTMLEVPDPRTGATKFVLVKEDRPVTVVDFIMKFTPPVGGRIDIEKVRDVLKALSKVLNWVYRLVTYDQYQSASSINAWNAEGVESRVFSVDKDMAPYELFRSAIHQARFSCYKYPPLKKDIASLDWNSKKQKVDHRPGGSKDVSDCAAAVVAHVEKFYPSVPSVLNPSRGLLREEHSPEVEMKLFDKEVVPGLRSVEEVISEKDYDPFSNLDDID